jgi:glycosyltransferase involved in cell wall biosynthesis
MIVKNEAAVIRRCLRSVLPFIDYWVIVDTGSSDGTQEIISSFFREAGVPGELHERTWKDFAYNRSEALGLARPHADYTLIVDADDTLEKTNDIERLHLEADSYELDIEDTNTRYQRTQIVSSSLPWSYRGVLHEFLHCDRASTSARLPLLIRRNHDGARRRDPNTYRKDAAILEAALLAETDPFMVSRYKFYLAQSYRDCGEHEKALAAYLHRAELGFWQEEVFVALYEAAKLTEKLARPEQEVIDAYCRATDAQPARSEALHGVSRYCRLKSRYQEGYQFARRGLELSKPSDALFEQTWIYDYGLLDELEVNAYWTGRYADCIEACDVLLSQGHLPPDQRDRVLGNRQLAVDKQQDELGSLSAERAKFVSLLAAARAKESTGRPVDEVIAAYTNVAAAYSAHAEPLHDAARYCRSRGMFARALKFATDGLARLRPHDTLPANDWIYRYGLVDEFAVSAYWIGRYADCIGACDRLLSSAALPAKDRDRVRKNKEFAAARLQDVDAAKQVRGSRTSKGRASDSSLRSAWTPTSPIAGTELMVEALRARLGAQLNAINLKVNHPGDDLEDKRPRVVWLHHNVDQLWVQWCKDARLVASVDAFVFISYWQRERYLNAFGLPPERCFVLKYAIDRDPSLKRWEGGSIWRCAYTSTPFRGLSVLLEAWDRLRPANAELHVWSSMKLYQVDDSPYESLYQRAESLPNVIYHGVVPNAELRENLKDIHFLTYPCTFEETACLAVIEAMASGCRVIVPSLGALPETTAGYARIYPSDRDDRRHAEIFSRVLANELANPWGNKIELSAAQQDHCAAVYGWDRRIQEWQALIDVLLK